jgi:hypothetical protein
MLHWLHVNSTRFLTHLAWHASRGRQARDEIGIWPRAAGTTDWQAMMPMAVLTASVEPTSCAIMQESLSPRIAQRAAQK